MERSRSTVTARLLRARFASFDAISGFGSVAARPLRFLVVGAVTFALNIGLLLVLTSAGLDSVVAYALALAVSVQFNFVVNQLLVWHDRPLAMTPHRVAARWVTFHACIAVSLAINMVAFAITQLFLPDILAALVAVGASTAIKFVSLDRFAFR
jgi:putative flippase GtrA